MGRCQRKIRLQPTGEIEDGSLPIEQVAGRRELRHQAEWQPDFGADRGSNAAEGGGRDANDRALAIVDLYLAAHEIGVAAQALPQGVTRDGDRQVGVRASGAAPRREK